MVNRLTEKHIVDNIDCGYKIKKDTCEDGIIQGWNKTDAINKLGQLEDLEEELGIGLITLFMALNKKLASLYKNQEGKWVVKPLLYDYVLTPKEFVEMAFTKEELEGK